MPKASFAGFALTYYLLAGLGVNLGYHRVLSHRSLTLPKWLERALVTIGLPAGTPVQWAGNHRYHHMHTDTALDPHSPRHRGFWYAHVGWYLGSGNTALCILYSLAGPVRMLLDAWMRPRTNQEYNGLARDVAADSYYAWVSHPESYAVLMHLHLGIAVIVAVWGWGLSGVVGLWLIQVVLYNLGDAIDSIAHLYGNTLPGQRDTSRNSLLMGLLILGEGWHANHHRFPWSAKHGLGPGEFDWTWQVIQALRAAGLAREIRVPHTRDLLQLGIVEESQLCK
ncbi:MAG TPA: acyl-CoA desaturase [Terriglobales bacterium]|nr:acyl-CoA desaturase [Terriglobales bacterium]